jgi:hypothetical protein
MINPTYGRPFIVKGTTVKLLDRITLGGSDYDENYVRNLAFNHPEALPIHEIDGSYRGAVPICTELNTPAGPIDALLVNQDGRIIIFEAKL